MAIERAKGSVASPESIPLAAFANYVLACSSSFIADSSLAI